MSIKPVLVPDQDAKTLRSLLESFDAAATGTAKNKLTESADMLGQAVSQLDQMDLAELTKLGLSIGLGSVAATAGVIGGYELGDKFMSLMHRTMNMVKKKAEVDTEEIIKLQRQIVSIHKRLKTLKSEPAIAKYQTMLKQAYEVLEELEARQGNQVAEAHPDVMRHRGDTTIRVVKKAGKPIGEIGIDSEASPGNGPYYVKLYDGSYDAVGFDSAEEALAELKYAVKQMSEDSETGIGSKLPKSDIETFGLQKGRPYKINPPQDWKPGDRKRAVQQLIPTQDKKDHIRSRLGKHVAPVLPESDMAENNPVVNAITRRIMLQHTDLLSKYGPELVGQAVDEVADFVGDVEEIGSSDVSGWVRHVEQMLGNMSEGRDVPYNDPNLSKAYNLGYQAYKGLKNNPQLAQAAQDRIEADFPQYARMWTRGYQDGERFDQEKNMSEASPTGVFKQGDKVKVHGKYNGTVVGQDGDTYYVQIDGQPGSQAVSAASLANPAATVAESIDPVEQLRADIQRFAR